MPRIEGIADFKGPSFHTYHWPHEGVDLAGKRVGIIGAGATAIQVIGEIADEHDADEAELWTEEKPGTYLALAKTPLEEFEAAIGRSLTHYDEVDVEEVETLGGLVFMLCGHVPARGEVVELPDGVEFEVVDADPRRIKRLRVILSGSNGND